MRNIVLGWVLFFGGIFVAIDTLIRLFTRSWTPTPFYQPPDPVEYSILLTLAVVLIWGGWKITHRKGGKK